MPHPLFRYLNYLSLILKIIMLYNDIDKMVFTSEELILLQAINNKSPHEYTPEEKVIVENICIKNKKEKVKQGEYFRKYLKTDKGKIAHRKASQKYYKRIQAEKKAQKAKALEKNKEMFKEYLQKK